MTRELHRNFVSAGRFFLVLYFFTITSSVTYTQTKSNLLTDKPSLSTLFSDSTSKKDSTKSKKRIETFRMKKSPWLAVLFSVIPGGGQLYNQSYWKVPILLGLSAYFGYEYYDQNKKFISYRDQYSASQTPSNQYGDPYLKSQREFYRNQRDDFLWYFMIVDFINLVDAYVDAQLFDFNVKEEKINSLGKIDRTYNLKFHLNF